MREDAGDGGISSVYANTACALCRVDPETLAITKIALLAAHEP